MKSERITRRQSEEAGPWKSGALRPGELPVEFPGDFATDKLARLVDCVRAEAQVAPEVYLHDAIVPKGGE